MALDLSWLRRKQPQRRVVFTLPDAISNYDLERKIPERNSALTKENGARRIPTLYWKRPRVKGRTYVACPHPRTSLKDGARKTLTQAHKRYSNELMEKSYTCTLGMADDVARSAERGEGKWGLRWWVPRQVILPR